ncbi:MAG TPA: hypothetical protein VNX68_14405, partial [Nitrosopumilaceae archaeon]|nr:hypothetical protein [Nitrosopumilaceae archaeon]
LVEKCYKGREMSETFVKRISTWFPDIHKTLDRKEYQMEEELMSFLLKFQIYATKKSDKRSLPYTNVVTSTLMLASDISEVFAFEVAYRKIVLELLSKDVRKIRFYVHIESYDNDSTDFARAFGLCGLKYCFRYYIH